MGNDQSTDSKLAAVRRVINDIRLLLVDLLGMGNPDADKQMVIEVFFGLMGYLAKADRLVSSHETDLADALMDETSLSMAARRIASEAFERGMRRDINVQAELLRFTDAHPASSASSNQLYEVLVRLATADGRLDPREYDALTQITEQLGLPVATLDAKLALYNVKR